MIYINLTICNNSSENSSKAIVHKTKENLTMNTEVFETCVTALKMF